MHCAWKHVIWLGHETYLNIDGWFEREKVFYFPLKLNASHSFPPMLKVRFWNRITLVSNAHEDKQNKSRLHNVLIKFNSAFVSCLA